MAKFVGCTYAQNVKKLVACFFVSFLMVSLTQVSSDYHIVSCKKYIRFWLPYVRKKPLSLKLLTSLLPTILVNKDEYIKQQCTFHMLLLLY